MDAITRQRFLTRWQGLKNERESWIAHWRELSQNILPRTGRFLLSDRNKGGKKHNAIYDSTGTRASRVLSAGMMAGMNSPARPWFRLEVSDKALMKRASVKRWLDDATNVLRDIFQRSNIYRGLHTMYDELGVYGTTACLILPDFEQVLRAYPLTAGEYAISTDHRGEVTTLYREFSMTVAQMVSDFGLENVSYTVRNLYTGGRNLDAWFDVLHVIEPRRDRDPSKADSRNMPWRSVYLELASNENKVLRESGFNRFPALCPRWITSGQDIYGSSPAMDALGDIKQLQHQQLRKGQAIDYQTKPPLQMPSAMKQQPQSTLPGGVMYYDQTGPNQGIRTAFDVNLRLDYLLEDIRDVRLRVKESFYEDLFLMLAEQDGQMTATEVVERHEEKLLMLGPVIERQQSEKDAPLIDIAFERAVAVGLMPPAPQELAGQNLKVVFVSILAQAQRAVGTQAIDRLIGTVGAAIAPLKPDVMDKIDTDGVVDAYAEMLGVDPDLINSDDEVAAIREERRQQQLAAAQVQVQQAQADTAAKLGKTPTDGKNALTDLVGKKAA